MITSVSNPLVKRARKLRHRRFREAEAVFLIEGIAHVRQAADHEAPFERILMAPELLKSDGAFRMLDDQRAAGVEIVELGREAFESIVERDHPSGLAAIVEMQERPLVAATARPGDVFVALLDVGNPGNLGTTIRTVDAVAGAGVITVGETTDHYHPAAVKASMGTLFSVPVYRAPTLDDLFAWSMMEDVPVVATSARAELNFWDADYPSPSILLFGSEALGLPADAVERSSACVTIPMEGAASSLNLAVSVGVLLYEVKRRLSR